MAPFWGKVFFISEATARALVALYEFVNAHGHGLLPLGTRYASGAWRDKLDLAVCLA